jgi:hypothetical protein
MLKVFCHDQVKLLLERMDTNPEEFLHHSKWNPFLPNTYHVTKGTADHFQAFTFIERNMIASKFNKLCEEAMRRNAYNRILEVVINGSYEPREVMRVNSDGSGSIGIGTSSITLNPPTNTTAISIGDQVLTAADIKKIKSKTLFGRLFV